MNQDRPVILGYDCVSPLGTELEAQWRRAAAGESGVSALTRFPLREGFPVRIAGQVAEIDIGPYPFLRPREMAHWTSPVFKHALLVVMRALARSGIEITPETAPRVAVTFSSAIGGLDALIDADRTLVATGKLPQPFMNPNSCINMVGGKVAIATGATGPISSIVTACATGSSSLILGAMFIAQGMADVAICGAVDFPLVEPIVAGFATMNGAYRPREGEEPLPPQAASCPFSISRRGFVVSEGAGCIVIASRAFAAAHGLAYGIELAGWGMTADAHHVVAPNPVTVRQVHAGNHPPCRHRTRRHRCGQRPCRLDEDRGSGGGGRPSGGVRRQGSARFGRQVAARPCHGGLERHRIHPGDGGDAPGGASAHDQPPAGPGDSAGLRGGRRPGAGSGICAEERLRFRGVQRVSCVSPRGLI